MWIGTVAAALRAGARSPRRCERPRTASARLRARAPVVSLLGLVTITTLKFYGASLTLLSVCDTCARSADRLGKRLATLGPAAVVRRWSRSIPRATSSPLRGAAVVAAVSLHALDGDQSGRFLLGAPRALFGARDLQSARHVRQLELARPGRLRRGLRRHDSVLQHRTLHRPGGPRARRADISMLVGLPVAAAIYLLACRSLDRAAIAPRRRGRLRA